MHRGIAYASLAVWHYDADAEVLEGLGIQQNNFFFLRVFVVGWSKDPFSAGCHPSIIVRRAEYLLV